MENKDLISVIVPVYNVEAYLDNCLGSILGQTYNNFELILVDDGSTDNSGHICDRYAQTDSRVKVIHQPNAGEGAARNAGLNAVSGEYIAWVDSDDSVEPDYLEKLYTAILENGADMAICSLRTFDTAGNQLGEHSFAKNEIINTKEFFRRLAGPTSWYYAIPCNKLCTRRAMEGIRYPVGRIHADEYVCHRIGNNCERIAIITDCLYNYLRRPGSITRQMASIKEMDYVGAVRDRIDLYNSIGFYETMDIEVLKLMFHFYRNKRMFCKTHKQRVAEEEAAFRRTLASVKVGKVRMLKAKFVVVAPGLSYLIYLVKKSIIPE